MASSWRAREIINGGDRKAGRHGGESGARKRRNRAVLELFEDAAYEVDGESSSEFSILFLFGSGAGR
ncbi:hypothetical protein Leryth_007505 [Lithospermum erythrorhizon]|nr:hypothetical protein Leryth_007505 [Lithospermum erythrorhizon]